MTALLVVTLVSLVLAVVMSVIAWRVARNERDRADARVEALASDIQAAVAASGGGRRSEPMLRAVRPTEASADLFASTPSSASSRSVLIVGVGLFAFATMAALAVVFTSGPRTSTNQAQPISQTEPNPTYQTPPTDQTHPTDQTPLDLVALGQERDGDKLTVRGVVRNPSSAATAPLTAVVFAFDRDGGFVTSGRAALDTPVLSPNNDSTFTVTLPHAEHVVRYRVSFRTDAAVVAHVDRRHG